MEPLSKTPHAFHPEHTNSPAKPRWCQHHAVEMLTVGSGKLVSVEENMGAAKY